MKVIQELQGNRPIIVRVFDELARQHGRAPHVQGHPARAHPHVRGRVGADQGQDLLRHDAKDEAESIDTDDILGNASPLNPKVLILNKSSIL